MSWQAVVLDLAADEPLDQRIERLLAQQRAAWPMFRDGERALAQVRTRRLSDGAATILVQANPGRRRSTHAKVDPRSIAERPCFLCPQNMPVEERGIAFDELVVLPNPFPILPFHLTAADRQHRPQQLRGRVGRLLALAAAAGPELAVFYNGPRCGASAPDHFHFQICSAAGIPLLRELAALGEQPRGVVYDTFGRSVVRFASADHTLVQAGVEQLLERLAADEAAARPGEAPDEPMVNVIAHRADGRLTALVFPRKAHRPARYFAAGAERLAVSPAALEMAGILVVAEEEDLDRIDLAAARSIYEDVSLEPSRLERLLAPIGDR